MDRLALPFSHAEARVGKALFVDNPKLKPGKPLELRLGFATIGLGVWGRRRRPIPPGNSPQVELREIPSAALAYMPSASARRRRT